VFCFFGRERPGAPPPPRTTVPEGRGVHHDLLRSLERMEADLAEMQAEVERMRRNIAMPAPGTAASKPPR
jgi:hypothetical protein